MNKSKFLKRSLAALLAILMVATMIPSAFAAEGDPVHQDLKITVDTYSATQTENGDYTVTVWDSNDVTINWAPIPGTTLKLVTGGKNPNIERDLPCKLYLAENANIEGDNIYSVTLKETKKGAAAAEIHKLTITVKSSIPDNDATLKAIRVDNTSGNYAIGYLGDGANPVPGNISNVTKDGIVAHAIKGDIDNDNETVTITLPFGMTPGNVGFAGAGDTAKTLGGEVFATTSVHAKAAYTFNSIDDAKVVVTAKTGVKNEYKVIFKQEQVFESFTDAVDLEKLEEVKSGVSELNVELQAGDGTNLADYRIAANNWAGGMWIPTFTTTENVKRVMGTSHDASKNTPVSGATLGWDAAIKGEGFGTSATRVGRKPNVQANMFKLITSGHANWDISGANTYVYLLVRTAANPSGALVQVNLKPVAAPKSKAVIEHIQIDNVSETVEVEADQRLIAMTVDNTHDLDAGNTNHRDPDDPATDCYFHIKTNNPAWIEIPNDVKANSNADHAEGSGWFATNENGDSDSSHMGKVHFIDGVNVKSGSVLLRVHSEDGTYTDYTVRITPSNVNTLGLKRVELRTSTGTVIDTSTVGATINTPFELEVPYAYHAGAAESDAINSGDDKVLGDLELWVYTDGGATVVPGNAGANVADTVTNKIPETAQMGDKTCSEIAVGAGSDENTETPISNGWTTLENIWKNEYTLNSTATAKNSDDDHLAKFEDTLTLTVSNAKNTSESVYKVKLKRENPLEDAEITAVTANTAMDDDYIFSTATTLGNQIDTNVADIGQAYVGAVDEDGNELPTTVDEASKTIKIQVPYDWDNDEDTLYLTSVDWAGKDLYSLAHDFDLSQTIVQPVKSGMRVLNSIEQEDQAEFNNGADTCKMGFTDLAETAAATSDENTLYVVSEKAHYEGNIAINLSAAWLKSNAVAYKIYIEKVGAENTGRALNNVSVTSGSGVSASFNSTYDAITVSVPGAYNWSAYRADNSHDFKLHFDTSTGALVIDKGQYEVDGGTALASLTATTGKYNDTRTGTSASTRPSGNGTTVATNEVASIYQKQLNEYYDINDATFFVMDGELYVYDELSGKQTRITGEGGANGKFTNSNWGEIKTKQAEIRVYNEAQKSSRNYRLDLKVGEPSNEKDILSLKVGDVTATRSGNSFTAALAEDAEKEQALTLQLSDMATAMVNGEPYQADRKIDVSKEVTIVVTAEDGSKTNYSLTTTFGTVTPPDPDKKPSDNYTDIPSGTIGEYVKKGIDLGIMIGSGNKFLPDNKITRRDFALMVARADVMAKDPSIKTAEAAQAELLKQYSGTPKFDDTKKLTDIYNAAIEYCNKKDIISGKPGNKFDPAGNVTRLETARMISGWAEVTDESKTTNVNNIKDWNKINWGKQYVNSVYAAGLMSGYGDASNSSFRPAQNLTRAEAARVIVSTFEKKTGAN